MRMREHRTWVSPVAIPLYNLEIPPSIAPFKREDQECSVVWATMSFFSPKHFILKELKEPFCFDFPTASLEKAWRGFLPHLLGLVIRREKDSSPWCESEPSLVSSLIHSLRLPLLVQKAQPLQRANYPHSPERGPRDSLPWSCLPVESQGRAWQSHPNSAVTWWMGWISPSWKRLLFLFCSP